MKIVTVLVFSFLLLASCQQNEELPNLPPGSFQVSLTEVTENSATISWEKPEDPEQDSIFYQVYLDEEIIKENVVGESLVITNLEELTTYNGRIIAKDPSGNESVAHFSFITKKHYLKFVKSFTYNDSFNLGGYTSSLIKSNDGNYLITGKAYRTTQGGLDFIVLKVDVQGNLIWKKIYEFELSDAQGFKINRTNTGSIVVGHHYVLNLDSNGEIIWQTKIDSYDIADNSAELKAAKQGKDGNFYLLGGRGSEDTGFKSEAILTKLDPNGNILWEKKYQDASRNRFEDILITESNELLLFGSTGTSEYRGIDFWIIKVNENGERIWTQIYGKEFYYDFPQQIIETQDGNYVFVGFSLADRNVNHRSLYKIDPTGNLLWSSTDESRFVHLNAVAETNDLGFITCGSYHFHPYSSFRLYKYSNTGSTDWDLEYREAGVNIMGKSILSTSDGGFLILLDAADRIVLLKTDPEGDFGQD